MCNKLIDTYRLNNQVAKWKVALPGGKELWVNIEITISRGTFVFISACIYWIKEFPFLERQVLFLLFVAFPIKLWGTGHGPRCLRHVNRAGARERLPKFPRLYWRRVQKSGCSWALTKIIHIHATQPYRALAEHTSATHKIWRELNSTEHAFVKARLVTGGTDI